MSAIGGFVLTACGDSGSVITTDTSGSTSASSTTDVSSTTNPVTSEPPTTTESPTTTVASTTDASTTDVGSTSASPSTTDVSASTTDISTGSTGDASASTGGSTGVGDPCTNGVQDQDETDIDCGGAICGDCQDGQLCTVNEDCVSVACAGGTCVTPECTTDLDCAAQDDMCNTGTCDLNTFTCAKTPVADATPCDDADKCTLMDVCTAGVCAGALKDCKANDTTCGIGACNADSGLCETVPDDKKDGVACDDANGCTANTTCLAGFCGDPNNKGYAFYEPFLDNTAGWTLDTNWEIKPAAVSPAGGGGTGTDPADDHTATMDKGVAGTLVGGLLTDGNTPLNTPRCLTSPKINTAGLPTVWWTFWRHLHADYTPFSIQRLEVFNGNAWILLETGYPNAVTNDPNWKEIKFDITAHKNANMQVRICHTRGADFAYNHGGWSVDDVTISQTSCTP